MLPCPCSTISLQHRLPSHLALLLFIFLSLLFSSLLLFFFFFFHLAGFSLSRILHIYQLIPVRYFFILWFFPPVLYHLDLLFLFLISCVVSGVIAVVVVVVVHGRSPISLSEDRFSSYRQADKLRDRQTAVCIRLDCLHPISTLDPSQT